MKFKFDFSVDAWIQDVEIEAATEEEAIAKLGHMSLYEIIEEGYVKDFNIPKEGFDVEITERDVVTKVFNIQYDAEDVAEEGLNLEDLPTETEVELEYVGKDDDLEDLIQSELDEMIYSQYGIFPVGFNFDVKKER